MSKTPIIIPINDVLSTGIITFKKISHKSVIRNNPFQFNTCFYNDQELFFETPEIDFSFLEKRNDDYPMVQPKIYVNIGDKACQENKEFGNYITMLERYIHQAFPNYLRVRSPSYISMIISHEGDNLKTGVFLYKADSKNCLLKGAKRAKGIYKISDLGRLLGKSLHSGRFICKLAVTERVDRGIVTMSTFSIKIMQISMNIPQLPKELRSKIQSINTGGYFQTYYSFSDKDIQSKKLVNGVDVVEELEELRNIIKYAPGIGIEYKKSLDSFTNNVMKTTPNLIDFD